jgi:hypothetical protein
VGEKEKKKHVLTKGAGLSELNEPNRYAIVFVALQGTSLTVSVQGNGSRMRVGVEEGELDGVKQKRTPSFSSSTSRSLLLQRRPDAVAPPAPRNSPASTAMATEREMGREMMSGRFLEMV